MFDFLQPSAIFGHLRPSVHFHLDLLPFFASPGFANCVWSLFKCFLSGLIAVDGAFVGANVQVPHRPHLCCCRCCCQSYSIASSCRVCVCKVSEFCCVVFASWQIGVYACLCTSEFQAFMIYSSWIFLINYPPCLLLSSFFLLVLCFLLVPKLPRCPVCVLQQILSASVSSVLQELEALAWTLELMRPRYASKTAMIQMPECLNTPEHHGAPCAVWKSWESIYCAMVQCVSHFVKTSSPPFVCEARMQNLSMTSKTHKACFLFLFGFVYIDT